jgi:2-methylcitrate dehydratase PrpD
MHHPSRKLVPLLSAAFIAGALGFGAVQAVASPAVATEAACSLVTCRQACTAQYGEGTMASCSTGYCVCIR